MAVEYIVLTNTVTRQGRVWVAVCRELGTAAQARTVEQAISRLKENVGLHLETLERVGQREKFFRENGIVVHRTEPPSEPRVVVPTETLTTVTVRRLTKQAGDRTKLPVPA